MDRLKKERRETQIPPEVRLRAKNRAWDKIQRPVFRGKTGAWALAACTAALAALFVIFLGGPEERIAPADAIGFADVVSGGDNGDIGDIGDHGDGSGANTAAVIVPSVPIVPNTDNIGKADGATAGVIVPIVPIVPSTNNIGKADGATVDEPERIVLNFILPESGARLIWIVSSNH